MKYKTVKKLVPWCDKCEQEIKGNGSMIIPYKCECGEWEYSWEEKDYVLNKS